MFKKLFTSAALVGFLASGATVVGVAAAAPAQAISCADYPNVNKTWFKRTCLY